MEKYVLYINAGIVVGGTNDFSPTIGNNVVTGICAIVLGNTHIANGGAIENIFNN